VARVDEVVFQSLHIPLVGLRPSGGKIWSFFPHAINIGG
jgi:hypothetical protein